MRSVTEIQKRIDQLAEAVKHGEPIDPSDLRLIGHIAHCAAEMIERGLLGDSA